MNQNLKSMENAPTAAILLWMEQQRAVAIIRQLNAQLVTGDHVMGVVNMKIVDTVQRYEAGVDFYTGKFYGMTTSSVGEYVTLKDSIILRPPKKQQASSIGTSKGGKRKLT